MMVKIATDNPASAFASSTYSSTWAASKAFDGNLSTGWANNKPPAQQLGYDFGEGMSVERIRVYHANTYRIKAYDVQGSDDNTTWVTVASGQFLNASGWQIVDFAAATYRYWRLNMTSCWLASGLNVFEVEFWHEYAHDFSYTTGIKIDFSHPIVTDPLQTVIERLPSTVPINRAVGLNVDYTVFASSQWDASYSAEKAFDENSATRWHSLNTGVPESLGIVFPEARAISVIVAETDTYNRPKAYTIQASNDDTNWDNITTGELANVTGNQTISFANSTAYRYWRLYFTSSWSNHYSIRELYFYEGLPIYHANGLTVTSDTYDMSPEGELVSKQYKIKKVTKSEDNLSLFIWLYIPDRLRYLASPLTVAYNKAIGSFMGAGNMQVDSFSLSFAPTNIRTEPTPNEPIHLEATVLVESENILIYYRDRATDEAIEGTITVVSQAIHIDDIID